MREMEYLQLDPLQIIARSQDIKLYGRGLYEVMRYWETADQNPESTPIELQFAVIWQATPKVVFSATLDQCRTATPGWCGTTPWRRFVG